LQNPKNLHETEKQRRGGEMVRESYVVVHNIAKRHNVGTLARSATAFGVKELILVGRRDFNSFGSHGSTSHLPFRHFHSLSDARNFLKDSLSSKSCFFFQIFITNI
jgi:tRNA G18 (ribose-2'-O)-methylase SpoU